MATDIYSMLTSNYDPRAQQMQQQQAFQQQLGRTTDPRAFIAAVGSNLGGQLGGAAQGMFGGASPAQQKDKLKQEAMAEVQASGVDMTDQIAVLKAITQALAKRGLTAEAAQVSANIPTAKPAEPTNLNKLLSEQARFPKGSPQWNAYQGAIDKETTNADKETKLSTYGQQLVDAGIKPGSPEFVSAMNTFNTATVKAKEKGSGVTIVNEIPGQKKAVDIPKFRQDLQSTVKPYSQVIDAADTVITAVDLGIKEGNFVAAKGAATALVKAFGDGQVSRQEALKAGADPSLIGGGIDYVNELFTGTPSIDTMKKVKKTAEALKKINKDKRDKELNVQRKMAASVGLKDSDIENIFSGFQESKTDRTIVNTGVDRKTGRKVVKYSDGSVEYAN